MTSNHKCGVASMGGVLPFVFLDLYAKCWWQTIGSLLFQGEQGIIHGVVGSRKCRGNPNPSLVLGQIGRGCIDVVTKGLNGSMHEIWTILNQCGIKEGHCVS
jgi:hypothetical protein